MTALAIRIQGGHGYADHGRILVNVAGQKKAPRPDGAVTFDVAPGTPTIAVDVTVRRPPWATSAEFPEDDLETAHIDLDLRGKHYVLRWPLHPRLASTVGVARGGTGLELVLDYRFIDVTRYYLKGEVYARKHPETGDHLTLSALDPATNAEKPVGGSQHRPSSLAVHFVEWTIGRGCTLWCVALPTSIGWTAQDWMLFLVPKGPKHRARSLIDFDFTILRRYLLDPPRWSPAFLYAPVEHKEMKQVVDFRTPNAFEIYLKEPHPPARLLTQAAGAPRPTALVVPVPDDQGDGHYAAIDDGLLVERHLLSLRAALFASLQLPHIGAWTGVERFGCAGFSASALRPFDVARRAARSTGPEITLIGLIDPPQFTPSTAAAIVAWQRGGPKRAALVVGGDHLENIHESARAAGGGLQIHPPDENHFTRDPNAFAQAVYVPPPPVPWMAAPLVEVSDAEIAAARARTHAIGIAAGSSSDLVGWIRSTGSDRPLLTLALDAVPASDSLRKQLARLSTMELSGYIGWSREQSSGPREATRDLAAFVRQSSDLRHQWAVASGDVLTQIWRRWK